MKMYNRMESYVIARPTGQIENRMHAKYSDKKSIPECMFQCMKIADFKALQFGTKIIKIS